MDDSRVGTRFAGRYDIVGVLGQGGMGVVYEARHAFTSRAVAVKILHSVVARSANARERFLREAQASTSVGHPGIVEVLDAGVADDGSAYLALELLRGESLAHGIARGAIGARRMVEITVELLDALGAAHKAGLVHRDIKPENVFLARDPDGRERVRLLDFGITRSLNDTDAERLTRTGTVLGTPHYMSPEQARGNTVDPRSDIFSVGGLLFHGLTGRTPFEGTNYNILVVSIMTTRAPYLRSVRPELPPDLAAVVDAALEPDAAARFASADAMQNALRACNVPELLPPPPDIALSQTLASEDLTAGAIPGRVGSAGNQPPGVSTPPQPTATPPAATPAGQTVPRTAYGPMSEAPKRRVRWPLVVVGLLAAAAGAAGAVVLLRPSEDPLPPAAHDAPVPVAGVTVPPVQVMVPVEPEEHAAEPTMEPAEGVDAEEQQAALEEEDEAERRERARRARARREKQAADDAASAARSRCNSACAMEFHMCVSSPEARQDSSASLRCHQQNQICRLRCE